MENFIFLCGESNLRSTGGVLLKKLFFKISQYSQENTVLESLFDEVRGLLACNFI